MRKKLILILLLAAALVVMLVLRGCGKKDEPKTSESEIVLTDNEDEE